VTIRPAQQVPYFAGRDSYNLLHDPLSDRSTHDVRHSKAVSGHGCEGFARQDSLMLRVARRHVLSLLGASLSLPLVGRAQGVAELTGRRLELLKEMIPAAKRVAVPLNAESQNAPLQLRIAEAAARSLRIDLQPILEVRQAADLERAFQAAAQAHVDAAIRMIDPLVFKLREQNAALAVKYRVPVIYPAREHVLAGGLAAYGANLPQQHRQAAGLVDNVLKGAKPSELPVEQATKFEFVVNLKTAKTMGIAIPQSVLLRADEVIQ